MVLAAGIEPAYAALSRRCAPGELRQHGSAGRTRSDTLDLTKVAPFLLGHGRMDLGAMIEIASRGYESRTLPLELSQKKMELTEALEAPQCSLQKSRTSSYATSAWSEQ